MSEFVLLLRRFVACVLRCVSSLCLFLFCMLALMCLFGVCLFLLFVVVFRVVCALFEFKMFSCLCLCFLFSSCSRV